MKHVKREFYRTAHKKCENMCCLRIEGNLPKARRVNKNEHFYHLHGKWKQQRRVNKANTHTHPYIPNKVNPGNIHHE